MILLTKEISSIIGIERRKKGLTQQRFAETIGVGHHAISNIERNLYKKIDKDLLIKIFKNLDIDVSYVLEKNEILLDIKELENMLHLYLKNHGMERYLNLKKELSEVLLRDESL